MNAMPGSTDIKTEVAASSLVDEVRPAPELTVVIPTYNERDNVLLLVEKLRRTLAGIGWEAIFVDDNSRDGTADAVRAIGENDARVRCIRRIGRRGLSGACVEGMLASQARFVAVMDADLQHDETALIVMVEKLRTGNFDLVVASRHLSGGSDEVFSALRQRISRGSSELARRVLGVSLSDPMSGFFMICRQEVDALAPLLSSQGFKILVDIVASARGKLRVAEVPYIFRERQHGESKLDARVAIDFAALIVAKLTNDAVSFRFLMFCAVGLTGIGIHLAFLQMAAMRSMSFAEAQAIATVCAIAWNFVLNNALTYHDQRLAGWAFVTGLIRFEFICAVGALSNVGIASWIYDQDPDWWIAGLSGAVMGAVWNYLVSSAIVWKQR
jgi:dolichol-phosphate mannosyltransferase